MSDTPYIFDIAGSASFEQLVIENSFHKPVLVDFWLSGVRRARH